MKVSGIYAIAFGLSLLVLFVFSWLLNDSIATMRDKSDWEEHSQFVIAQLYELNVAMADIESSHRGFLLTGDSTLLQLLYSSRTRVPMLLDTLSSLTRDNVRQQRNLSVLRDATVRRLHKSQEVINRAPYLTPEQLRKELNEGNRLMDDFRSRIKTVVELEKSLLKERTNSRRIYESLTPTYFMTIFTVASIIAIASFIQLLRESTERRKAREMLELRLQTLAQLNSELKQIAYVTSHDLQEPLRKIQTFSDLLNIKYGVSIPIEARDVLTRVIRNANFIRELISDLSDFANLVNPIEVKQKHVDLNKVLIDVQKNLNGEIEKKQAKFFISTLPLIDGFERQLFVLFREVITNSLKFSRAAVPPEITVTGNLMIGDELGHIRTGNRRFTVISIYDNGIGFDNVLASKIFILFQKLHGSDSPYPGKGIGLAICQRILSNHDGYITARGESGKGTRIQMFFPIVT